VKTAVFDIETTDLSAVSGFILCAVIKEVGKKPTVLRYDRFRDKPGREIKLLKAILSELSKYDILVGHNIANFDIPFIKTRGMVLDVDIDLNPFVYDTLPAFRRTGILTKRGFAGRPIASLGFVADALGVPQMKTAIYPREHAQTHFGLNTETSMAKLVEHCVADVIMTEQVFLRLLKFDRKAKIVRI